MRVNAWQCKIFLKLDEVTAKPGQIWRWYQTGRVLYMLEERAMLWRNLGRLEEWAAGNLE